MKPYRLPAPGKAIAMAFIDGDSVEFLADLHGKTIRQVENDLRRWLRVRVSQRGRGKEGRR